MILGWEAVPASGDEFREVSDEREARHIASEREARVRAAELVISRPPTLSDLMRQAERAEIPELNLVVKADVQGSLGALTDAFLKLPQDEVRVNIVRSAAGGITENDITLAMASGAIVIGFNVRPDKQAVELADKEGVDIRTYRVIYDVIDDIKAALSGMLSPEQRVHDLGQAEVRETLPGAQARGHRGLLRHQRHDPARRACSARARQHRGLRRQDRVAAPVQGRREGSRVGLRDAGSGSKASRTSRKATSSRRSRSARSPVRSDVAGFAAPCPVNRLAVPWMYAAGRSSRAGR